MRRLVLALLLVATPAFAQSGDTRVFRLGVLALIDASIASTRVLTLPELARLGFVEGRNLIVDERIGEGDALARAAREMVDALPDAIIAIGSDALRAARVATDRVPIVGFGSNSISLGLAATLARPGGNVTGVVILGAELDGKRLDLLRETLPAARRIAVLMRADAPMRETMVRELGAVAQRAGLELVVVEVAGPNDYASAFARMRAAAAQGLLITSHPALYSDGEQLASLALESGLPTVCEWPDMARMGCMLGYGPDRALLRRRLADFVARIFRGAAPGALPIEIPTTFAFAVNLRTARTLGVTLPQALLIRADEVIE